MVLRQERNGCKNIMAAGLCTQYLIQAFQNTKDNQEPPLADFEPIRSPKLNAGSGYPAASCQSLLLNYEEEIITLTEDASSWQLKANSQRPTPTRQIVSDGGSNVYRTYCSIPRC